ncbi:MAG: hypothetical protein L0287_24695 [Anaerolineae bacterium]|nr:hypothetical protein [Anaerolineae bacterium]
MLQSALSRILHSTFCILFLISCSSTSPSALPTTGASLPTATISPTDVFLPTETATPKISNAPITIATQFCIASIAPWSCICGNLSSELIEIKEANNAGRCDVTMPQGYSINLPNNWYCNVAGAIANNLSCITEFGQRIFIQRIISELPLGNADEAVQSFYEGDGYISNPVVEPGEEKIEKEIITIGDKQTVRLLTKQEDSFILRYFIKNNDNLYVFIVKSKDLVETNEMTVLLDEIINSMQFVQ